MNILKRIKNLWKLSEIELPNSVETIKQPMDLFKTKKTVEIIKRTDPIEDFIKNI